MSIPSSNIDKALLETAVINHFNGRHRFMYAQIGSDLNILNTSDNFSFLLPEKFDTAIGHSLTEIFEEFIGVEEIFQAILNGEQTEFNLDYVTHITAQGDTYYLNLRVVNIHELISTSGLLLIVEDVTTAGLLSQRLTQNRNDLRLAQDKLSAANQELQHLIKFKSFLLSMLAHDMRTPLSAIRGYAELIQRLLENEQISSANIKTTNFANSICNVTDQLAWLIDDLIDFDRAEKGILTANIVPCQINQIVQETIAMHHSMVDLQNLNVTIDIEPPTLEVLADSQRLQQVINNLLGNAIKYTPTGGQITISAVVEGQQSALKITDNGRGMTPEQLNLLFQPYFRTKEAISSDIVGSGLGLFIVDSLIKAQNGRIEVNSKINHGTTFTVYLPLATPAVLETTPETPE